MEPPRGWRPLPERRAPFRVPPSIRRACSQLDWFTPRPAGEQAADLPALPRWKRLMLLYVIPVCLAMVWQLAVIIGFLAVFIVGLILSGLLQL